MQNQVIGRTRRNGWKQFAGTVVVMLSLFVGLMAQGKQARAQDYYNLPDSTPLPEDMWNPLHPFGGGVKPPTVGQVKAAVKACLEEVGTDKAKLSACILKKLGRASLNNNCDLIVKTAFPQYYVHGDPCIVPPLYERACDDCCEVKFMCALLKDGTAGAAKAQNDHTLCEIGCN